MASAFLTSIAKVVELRRNAKLTRDEFEARKLAKFRQLVAHANTHSAYYANIVRERGIDISRCTPQDFPPLTKSILMANFDAIVTDKRISKQGIADFLTRSHDPTEMYLRNFRVIHTSGSSGEVGYFVYSEQDYARGMAQMLRQRQSNRPNIKRRRRGRFHAAFYGAVGGHFAGVTMIASGFRGIARFFTMLKLLEVNDPLPETLAQLNDYQPELLMGYTGALIVLAEKQREGALRISPIAIATAGESLSAVDRRTLEDTFQCHVTNGYGSSEHLMMGGALPPDGRTMLLFDDDLIYEMNSDHTLVTNLFNYTLPLIRYRMSDILRPVVSKSDPTSPYLEIESLVGRTEMMPMFMNDAGQEDFISPHTINEIFVAGVTRFQMQLMDRARFRFLVCLDPQLSDSNRSTALAGVETRLREILAQKHMSSVQFSVDVVDDIPVNPRSRKFQLIVDKRT